MKKILFQRRHNPSKRIKTISMGSSSDDKECKTHIRKNFFYKVSTVKKHNPQAETPQIYIKKSFDTKKCIEKFHFRVKGSFYINHNRGLAEVTFRHTLNITIVWKSKIFSPKKSEALT